MIPQAPHDATRGADADPARHAATELQVADLWDRHSTSVYSLAYALLGNEAAAAQALRLGMTDLVASAGTAPHKDARRSWSRHVYRRSQELAGETSSTQHVPPPPGWLSQLTHLQRASLALCLFGGHTRPQVAELLDVPPTTVADLLTSGLRAVKHVIASEPGATA